MSYIALVTDHYENVIDFYGKQLGFAVLDQWDRPHGRGRRFDLGDLQLEILDNQREKQPRALGPTAHRTHIVVEVEDIETARSQLKLEVPPAQNVSWGALMFQIHDPDGVPITFLEWIKASKET